MKKIIITLVILIPVVLAGYFIQKYYFHEPDIKILEKTRVEKSDIREILVETGIIKPQVGAQVKIGTRSTGKITNVYVKTGDAVKRNQLVATIDDREITKEIDRLNASLNRAINNLKKINLTYPGKIREAEEDIAFRTAKYKLTRIEKERQGELLKKGYISQSALDKTETEYDQALSDLEKAKESLKRIKDEYRSEVKIAEADIKTIKESIEKEEIRLSYTRIYSPMDGIISDVTAQEGETIVTGLQVANLITILVPNRLEMWIYVDETDIGGVKKTMKVEYYVDTYPDKVFYGSIDRIYPQPVIKDNIVYYLAIVHIQQKDALLLRPEMTTHVRIIAREKKNVLAAPNAAIKYEEGRQVVYKVTGNNNVKKLPVQIGIRGEEQTEIISGVAEGEEIATKLILPIESKK